MQTRETTIHCYDARIVSQDLLHAVRYIARAAFSNELLENFHSSTTSIPRKPQEIDFFSGWSQGTDYYDHMHDPNELVGTRFRANQQYWKPKLIVAKVFGEPVGFMYTAHNTSSSSHTVRWLKHQFPPKNYLWIRSAAVLPEYQNNDKLHLGTSMAALALQSANPRQPVTAYVMPQETPDIVPTLQRYGFVETDEPQLSSVFGPESIPALVQRMQAPSAELVASKLVVPPGLL